jgi:hypothetical protein
MALEYKYKTYFLCCNVHHPLNKSNVEFCHSMGHK